MLHRGPSSGETFRQLLRRRRWRWLQGRLLPVLAVAALGAWVWPSLAPLGPPAPSPSAASSGPKVLRGGDAWGGVARAPQTSRPKAQAAGRLTGRVTHVRDGDTIELGRTAVRLANLDCAERGSPAGTRATKVMQSLVRGKRLRCTLEGRRSYDREVGRCQLPSGQDLGRAMIARGVCRGRI